MKSHKRASKRISLQKKNKIVKKVKEHRIKVRKANKGKSKIQDKKHLMINMIPNSAPYKMKLLEDLEKQEILRKNQSALLVGPSEDEIDAKNKINDILVAKGVKKQYFEHMNRKYEIVGEDIPSRIDFSPDLSLKCVKELEKIIDESNIIIEVLDARNPSAFRCIDMEEKIKTKTDKKLILLLNRCDKVPKSILISWLNMLRKSNIAFPFKSFNDNISASKKNRNFLKSSSNFDKSSELSCEILLKYLKDLQTSELFHDNGKLQSLKIGIIGCMNSGKKSIINTLKLFKNLKPFKNNLSEDSMSIELEPSIFLNLHAALIHSTERTPLQSLINNSIKLSDLKAPEKYAEHIYNFLDKDMLRYHYCLPEFNSFEKFITFLALSKNLIGPKGIPNQQRCAFKFVRSWIQGNIPFYTLPDEENTCIDNLTNKEIQLIDLSCASMAFNPKSIVPQSVGLCKLFENTLSV